MKLIDYPLQLCLCVSFSFDGRGCMHLCVLCVWHACFMCIFEYVIQLSLNEARDLDISL